MCARYYIYITRGLYTYFKSIFESQEYFLKTFLAIQYSYAYYYSNIACSSGDESNVKICHNVDATK